MVATTTFGAALDSLASCEDIFMDLFIRFYFTFTRLHRAERRGNREARR